MAQLFKGIFSGDSFRGTFSARCGEIIFEDGDHHLEIYWELGSKGCVLIGSIPCNWKFPAAKALAEKRQLEILDALESWLRLNKVPNDLSNGPWMNAPDDIRCKCAWARCETGVFRAPRFADTIFGVVI